MRLMHILAFCLVGHWMMAQAPLSTQFMFNKLAFNPAYAGHYDNVQVLGTVRNQWIGFPGAPKVQQASANIPFFDNSAGLGISLSNHSQGISSRQTIDGAYAYKLPVNDYSALSIGLQSSISRYQVDYTNADLIAIDGKPIDPSIPQQRVNQNLLNFGVGIYYSQEDFYAGISVPKLTLHKLGSDALLGTVSDESRPIYGMIGGAFDMDAYWTFNPELLITYTDRQPWDLDLNMSVVYDQRLRAGIGYRLGGDSEGLGESLDFIFAIHVTDELMIGAAYDYNLSQIQRVSSGSLEVLVSYTFGQSRGREINPRFF